jgi:hypothetical protein
MILSLSRDDTFSLQRGSVIVFYYYSPSEIWPYKRGITVNPKSAKDDKPIEMIQINSLV